MEDFDHRRRGIVAKVREAITRYENNPFLKVEPEIFERIKQDIRRLFTYQGDRRRSEGFKSTGGFPSASNFR